jgi:hypothetical protein
VRRSSGRKVSRSGARAQFCYTWNNIRLKTSGWTHAWLVAVDYANVRAFLVPRSALSEARCHRKLGHFTCQWQGSNDHPTEPLPWLKAYEVR